MSKPKLNTPEAGPELTYTQGDFYPNGAFTEHGTRPLRHDPLTELYWFVDMLCTKRQRSPEAAPWEYARRISASRFGMAFPNAMDTVGAARWTATIDGRPAAWWQVAISTAAEAAVLLGGKSNEAEAIAWLFAEEGRRADVPQGVPSEEQIRAMLGRLVRARAWEGGGASNEPISGHMPPRTVEAREPEDASR